MSQQKNLSEDLGFLQDLQDLCTAYEQISVMKMQKIRDRVLATRSFYTKLSSVYHTVKTSYRQKVLELARRGKIKDPQILLAVKRSVEAEPSFFSSPTEIFLRIIGKY